MTLCSINSVPAIRPGDNDCLSFHLWDERKAEQQEGRPSWANHLSETKKNHEDDDVDDDDDDDEDDVNYDDDGDVDDDYVANL